MYALKTRHSYAGRQPTPRAATRPVVKLLTRAVVAKQRGVFEVKQDFP